MKISRKITKDAVELINFFILAFGLIFIVETLGNLAYQFGQYMARP